MMGNCGMEYILQCVGGGCASRRGLCADKWLLDLKAAFEHKIFPNKEYII